jgi:tetratricopeptide (TPR) repeat protein
MRKNITNLILILCLSASMISYSKEENRPVWVIGKDIINKINAGEFEDVEKYMGQLVTQKLYTVDGTRVLEEIYTFVGDRLENSEMLDKWCAKEPSHHSSFILRGNYYINLGWKYRGTGFGYTVTEEGRKKLNEYLELAKKDFAKAYSMNPADPNSASSMIRVCTGLNMGKEDMETWFKRAIEADPASYAAYARKQNYLRPKWHGTPEKDKAFADYCYNNAPEKSVVHEIMLDYIIEEYQRSGSKTNYFNDPSITKTIDAVVKKTLANFPDSTSIRRKLAQIEAIKQNYGKAVSLYNEIFATDPGNPDTLRLRGNLFQYAGTYELNPDTNVIIRLLNGRLILQLTGQPVIALTQESDVIFFHRILKTGVEFFRDQSGNIAHLMLTHNGIEKKAVRTSDKVFDKNAVTLTADTLSQYVGTYKMPTLDLMITMEGNQLFAQFPGMMLKVLFPESETLFFDNIIDTRLEFFKDKSGKVTHLVFTQGNVGITAPRVEKATVSIPVNYSLTEKTAIKTGGGPKGEHDYLNMLCGPNGEKIKYKRLGSCCVFETKNSPFGNTGLLDTYEVTYEGLKDPVIIFLNMYDPPTGKFSAPFGLKMRN